MCKNKYIQKSLQLIFYKKKFKKYSEYCIKNEVELIQKNLLCASTILCYDYWINNIKYLSFLNCFYGALNYLNGYNTNPYILAGRKNADLRYIWQHRTPLASRPTPKRNKYFWIFDFIFLLIASTEWIPNMGQNKNCRVNKLKYIAKRQTTRLG